MEPSDVAAAAEGALEMKLEPYDDMCPEIQYAGPGLDIRSMQVRCPDPDWQEEFTAAERAFIADGELDCRVGVRIALAAAALPPAECRRLSLGCGHGRPA